MKTSKSVKRFSWILVLIMIVSVFPQAAFAGETKAASSVAWDWSFGIGTAGNIGIEYMILSGMEKEDVGFESTDESVLPEKCIWVSSESEVKFFPIKAGTTTVTMYNKKDTSVKSKPLKFTISKGLAQMVYIDKDRSLSAGKVPFVCKYRIDDESVATVDDKGAVTGRKIGTTTLHITSDEVSGMDCTKEISVAEDPTGIYYSDQKITELNWNKSQGTSVKLKVINGEFYSSSDVTTSVVYDTSNVDVAEPVYRVNNHMGTGEITLKKNGTATVYIYSNVQRTKLLGTCKITVSGFDETSQPDNGWTSCTEPQGYNSKVRLLDFPVETQSYNQAAFNNKTTQFLKANSISFALELTNTGKKYEITEQQKKDYERELLSRINICEVDKDGTIGKKVASNNNGYRLKTSSYETLNSTVTNLTIIVDKDELKKGTTYALVADADVDACVSDVEYYLMNENVPRPIGAQVSWQFTTIGGAQKITLNQSKATLKGGQTLVLKATLNEGIKVEADDSVTWSSSNSTVAAVDKNGKVTAKKAGTAVITAQAVSGKVKAACKITVSPERVKGVKVSTKKATLTVGNTKTIKAAVTPSNATNQSVTWASSNSKVAKVNSKGKVTAVAPGTATITVKTKDGSFKAKTAISVKPKTTSLKLKGKRGAIAISYKKVSNVTAYQIYRAKSKNGAFKRIATRSQKRIGKYTSTRLSRKHTYYYKIRTYKTVKGKKIYSSFSKTVKAKTK